MVIKNDDSAAPLQLESVAALQAFVTGYEAAAVYFSGENCGVCQVMEPKVRELLDSEFPRFVFARVATANAAELAAQHGVFTVPTLLIFFDGRESFRYARNFSLGQLRADLARPYQLFFG